jgi:ribosome assembly protein YihI (activator of Der GTPase)
MDERVDVLLAALESEHMSVTRAAAAELITDRVQSLMSQLRIAEATARTYLDDDALAGLARTMVASLGRGTTRS